MPSPNPQAPLLSIALPDTTALHRAFMPFIEGGGLFVATPDRLPLNTDVMLQVDMMNEPVSHTISGRIVWLTPNHAQDGRMAGIGVQFDAAASATLLPIIQAYLVDAQVSELPNHTM